LFFVEKRDYGYSFSFQLELVLWFFAALPLSNFSISAGAAKSLAAF
jgi:hypothetical protein